MKHRIFYSETERLYHIQSKNIFSKWTNRNGYFITDKDGDLRKLSGFPTFNQAEEWLHDRYPGLNLLNKVSKNENIGFEF